MSLLLGLDVGTTAIKALLYESDTGRSVRLGQCATPIRYPTPGRSEFDPNALWAGVVRAIRGAIADLPPGAVAGVAVASMGEVGLPLDRHGDPCYPAITWFDRRSEEFLPWWEQNVGALRTYQITGQVLHYMYGALKMQWLRSHEPAVWRRIHRWLSIEDYVNWKLTGCAVSDQSVASRTLLFDQEKAAWSPELLEATGIPLRILPRVGPSGTPVGDVTVSAAAETGLLSGTPVASGGHDHLVGALAVGAARPGVLLDSAGTAESILVTAERYVAEEAVFAAGFSCYRHVVPGRFVIVAGQHGAGGLVNWLIDRLYPPDDGERPYARAFADAAAAPLGAGGVLCLPHLRGSRVPERDPQSRAAFVGLVDGHERGHILRAALEGLGYWLRASVESLTMATGMPVREVVVIGGATRAPLWMQIKADCARYPLRVPAVEEAVALGAALLAGVGVGVYASADAAAAAASPPTRIIQPSPTAVRQYARGYAVYRRLYPALREVHRDIRTLGEGADALTIL